MQLAVDCKAPDRPISPYIYGIAGGGDKTWGNLQTASRWGGNRTSRYNWQTGDTNTGSDWFFENPCSRRRCSNSRSVGSPPWASFDLMVSIRASSFARPPLVYLYYTAQGNQDFGHGTAGAVILAILIMVVTLAQGRIFGFGRAE